MAGSNYVKPRAIDDIQKNEENLNHSNITARKHKRYLSEINQELINKKANVSNQRNLSNNSTADSKKKQ